MKSLFERFKKKKKPIKEGDREETQSPEKENLATLIREYRDLQATLNLVGPSDSLVYKMEKAKLRELGERIISLLADDFQKNVFRILLKYNVNLLEFLEQDWKELLRKGFENIASYLDSEHPLNFAMKQLPDYKVSGRDFLFWMLQQAKAGSQENRYLPIGEAIMRGNVCGYQIPDKKTTSGEKLVNQVALIAGIVMMSKEYSLQFKILMEIICEIEGGEQFIREELYSKVGENLFEEGSPSYED